MPEGGRQSAGGPLAPAGHATSWSSLSDRLLCPLLLVAGLLLRIGYAFKYRFNTDEPQHLHVAWSWTHGLVQYRDIFDNHTPLFHLLCAPLVYMLGDRADLLALMRLALIPIYVLTLWGTHRLARNLFHPRLALWLTALAGLFPPFYWASIEFRTDTLWAMLWIWALALLTAPALGAARGLAAGLILGAAFSVSMKSSLLLACLLAALAGAIALGHKTWPPLAVLRRYGSVALTTVAGLLVIPGALVAWFHAHGALGAMIYGVIQHNMLPQLGRSRDPRAIRHIAFTLVVMALLALAYRLFFRKAAEDERSEAGGSPARQGLLFLFTGIYLAAVHFLWPLITRQDYLPVWPLIVLFGVALVACPLLARLATVFEPRWDPATSHWPYLAAGLIELLILTATLPFYWRGSAQQDYRTWDAVLTLTTPAETVMDTKGNLIFRNRAEYWGLEKITRERMKRGLIPNLINQHLIETSTCVIQPDLREFPDRNQKFIEANYLSVGPLLVAGQRLKPDAAQPGQPIAFTVRIATDYTVLASGGEPARGLLDGQPCAGGRFLAAGAHAYQPAPGETGDFALLWRRAVEHDYRPAGFGKGR